MKKEFNDRDETVERKEEFEEGVAKLLNKLFGIVYRRTLNVDLANDLVQEAAYHLYRRMDTQNWLQDIESFDAYASRILLNCLNTHYRKQKKMLCVSLDGEDEKLLEEVNEALSSNRVTSVNDDDMDLQELREEVLRQLLDGLSENDQFLLELHKVDERSPKEIAAITGEHVDSVKRQLQKIEARLRQRAKRYLKASGTKSFF